MAGITMTGRGDVSGIAGMLSERIQGSGISCRLVDTMQRRLGDGDLIVMVFEKYFMRASNRVSLTVVISGREGEVQVDAIGSGGGQGPLFSFSWGAEESFAGTVQRILADSGFR